MVRRRRFQQSWYGAFVLGVPTGTGPEQQATSRYGNMLREVDEASGSDFLTDEIHQISEVRIAEGGTVEPFRCRHNMLEPADVLQPDRLAEVQTRTRGRVGRGRHQPRRRGRDRCGPPRGLAGASE